PLIGALAILVVVPLAYALRQRDRLASVVSCNAVDPRGSRSPLNVLSCLYHDAQPARWDHPSCELVRPMLEAMTAPARFPRTRELLAWRMREDAGHNFELRGQAQALELFDACVEEGG